MRIAVLVIGLCLTFIIGLQSCAVSVGGGLAKDQALAGGGSSGIVVAFLFVLGSAFALGLPRVSVGLFLVAALIGIAVGQHSGFANLTIWGCVSLALAAMSYFGSRELRRKALSKTSASV